MSRARRQLYRAARDLGDIEAAARGPEAFARRQARRQLWRLAGRILRRTRL